LPPAKRRRESFDRFYRNAILVALKLAVSFTPSIRNSGQKIIRLITITVATSGLAIFNVASGMAGVRFAWDSPYLALNTATFDAASLPPRL
jgi:hypothetical protein